MASEYPHCSRSAESSLENNLDSTILSSTVFISSKENNYGNSKKWDLDKRRNSISVEEVQNYGNGGIVGRHDFVSLSKGDAEVLEADLFLEDVDIGGSVLGDNWKEEEDFMIYYVGREMDRTLLYEVANWLDGLEMETEGIEGSLKVETACLWKPDQEARKGTGKLGNTIFENYRLIAGLNYLWNSMRRDQTEREGVFCNTIPFYGDYRVSANRSGFINEKVQENRHYQGSQLSSWMTHDFWGGFQGSKTCETELSKEKNEIVDTWQDNTTKLSVEFGSVSLQSVLEDLPGRTAQYGCRGSGHGEVKTLSGIFEVGSDGETPRGAPHDALFFTLSYLSLQDLLSVERVCKSLHVAVKNDALLWQNIHVEHPLSERLTDDALLQLSERSQGQLQCLSLVKCSRITDNGLKRVLDISPKLTKLCLPGCRRITAEGIVKNVKAHRERKDVTMPGLKQLRIGGLYGVTREHLEKLNYLLDGGLQQKSRAVKPRFYHNGHYSLSYDDDRSIDIEACPKCGNPRLVYDCTMERCQQGKDHTLRECRGCTFCIARCDVCGRCINDIEYEETFCLGMLCANCWPASEPRIHQAWLW